MYSIDAMVNAHSHVFQRELRGIGERPSGSTDDFWSWRDAMYRVALRLTPDDLYANAVETYREMKAAGYGVVGEFHYLHHQPNGKEYDDPNAMAKAVAAAAREAGMEIVLLPAAYARSGFDGADLAPMEGQRRFCDLSVVRFLSRVDDLRSWAEREEGVSVGVAAHSVRAVPAEWLREIATYSDTHQIVRHIHAHEQIRELDECYREHDMSPIELLAECRFLGPSAAIIHGIHVTDSEISLIADGDCTVITCPTTEGNLGDGYFPAMRYLDQKVKIAIGSDSNVIIDPFEEVRELETGARRERQTRRALLASYGDLWKVLVTNGSSALGLSDGERSAICVTADGGALRKIDEQDLRLAIATAGSRSSVVTANS